MIYADFMRSTDFFRLTEERSGMIAYICSVTDTLILGIGCISGGVYLIIQFNIKWRVLNVCCRLMISALTCNLVILAHPTTGEYG